MESQWKIREGDEGTRERRGTRGDEGDEGDVTFFREESNKEPVCDVKVN